MACVKNICFKLPSDNLHKHLNFPLLFGERVVSTLFSSKNNEIIFKCIFIDIRYSFDHFMLPMRADIFYIYSRYLKLTVTLSFRLSIQLTAV